MKASSLNATNILVFPVGTRRSSTEPELNPARLGAKQALNP